MADGEDLAYLDGVDAYDLGLRLTAMPGIHAPMPFGYAAVNLPERPGMFISSAFPRVGPRVLVLRGRIDQTTQALAETTVATLLDAITERTVRISFAHKPNVSYYGVYQEFMLDHDAPAAQPGRLQFLLSFLCEDPWAVDDVQLTASGIAAEKVAIQVGDGPTYPEITVNGSAASPTVTLRDHTGTSRATIALTVTVSTGDSWRISTLDGTSEDSVSSTVASNMDDLNPVYTMPVILPRYADRALSFWPTLETSTGTLYVRYARRWH